MDHEGWSNSDRKRQCSQQMASESPKRAASSEGTKISGCAITSSCPGFSFTAGAPLFSMVDGSSSFLNMTFRFELFERVLL